jgi:hypothetical protein
MRIFVRIVGVAPLILNRFTEKAAMAATSGVRGSSLAEDRGTPQEQADERLYRGLDGAPVIPQPNLLRCIVDGGRFHKIGKKQVTTQSESMLFGCLDIEEAVIKIIHTQPWRVDTVPVVIPATKGRILVHRPCFDDWALEFELSLDTTILGPGLLRRIVDDAGKRVGLGAFRPARKGPFGRFRVDQWREVDEAQEMLVAAE